MTRYFTEGELLPWKGRWLKLESIVDERITFSLAGETNGELKRRLAEEKWTKQHPQAKRIKHGSSHS